MFSKTCFSSAICALSLFAGCATQHTALTEPAVTPASTAVSGEPAIECPGTTIRSAAEADHYAACELIAGDLTIVGTTLENLLPLSNLRALTGRLTLTDNPRLESLRGLEQLQSAQGIFLEGNRALENLAGLEGVRELDELVLHQNGLLTVHGLEDLSRVGGLEVTDNPKLIDLSGLNSVTHARSVHIEGNPRLAGARGLLRSLEGTEEPIVVKGNLGLSLTEAADLRAKGFPAFHGRNQLRSAYAP